MNFSESLELYWYKNNKHFISFIYDKIKDDHLTEDYQINYSQLSNELLKIRSLFNNSFDVRLLMLESDDKIPNIEINNYEKN